MKVTRIAPKRELRKKRVAAYCRVSTGLEEQADSLDAQKEYYEQYIKANPEWEFAGIYYDEQSGTKAENREGLQRMARDAEAGLIDHILVKSVSRAFRNAVDAQDYAQRLNAVQTTMYFEEDGINTGDTSAFMMFGVMSAMAQEQSRSIGENVAIAYHERFKRGEYNLGNNRILGYDSVDGQLVPNEDAWIVKEVFERFANGEGYKAIADALNSKGAKRLRSDKPFNVSCIQRMVRNETYVGDKKLQKQAPQDYLTKKPKAVTYESYYLHSDHEGIIERDVWEKAKARVEQMEKDAKDGIRREGKDHHAFYGHLFCAECGQPYRRRLYSKSGVKYNAWNCRERQKGKNGNGCKNAIWKEDILTKAVCDMLGWDAFDGKRFEESGVDLQIEGNMLSIRTA